MFLKFEHYKLAINEVSHYKILKKRFEKPCFWSLNIMSLQLVKFLIIKFWKDTFQQVD
jgi:hypothetical protein